MTILIEDLKKNDIIYECEYGRNIEYIVLGNPKYIQEYNGYTIKVKRIIDEKTIEFFQTVHKQYRHYGPKLYKTPQYMV